MYIYDIIYTESEVKKMGKSENKKPTKHKVPDILINALIDLLIGLILLVLDKIL